MHKNKIIIAIIIILPTSQTLSFSLNFQKPSQDLSLFILLAHAVRLEFFYKTRYIYKSRLHGRSVCHSVCHCKQDNWRTRRRTSTKLGNGKWLTFPDDLDLHVDSGSLFHFIDHCNRKCVWFCVVVFPVRATWPAHVGHLFVCLAVEQQRAQMSLQGRKDDRLTACWAGASGYAMQSRQVRWKNSFSLLLPSLLLPRCIQATSVCLMPTPHSSRH